MKTSIFKKALSFALSAVMVAGMAGTIASADEGNNPFAGIITPVEGAASAAWYSSTESGGPAAGEGNHSFVNYGSGNRDYGVAPYNDDDTRSLTTTSLNADAGTTQFWGLETAGYRFSEDKYTIVMAAELISKGEVAEADDALRLFTISPHFRQHLAPDNKPDMPMSGSLMDKAVTAADMKAHEEGDKFNIFMTFESTDFLNEANKTSDMTIELAVKSDEGCPSGFELKLSAIAIVSKDITTVDDTTTGWVGEFYYVAGVPTPGMIAQYRTGLAISGEGGRMVKSNWSTVSGNEYYSNAEGMVVTNAFQDKDGKTWFLTASGAKATTAQDIRNTQGNFRLTADGSVLKNAWYADQFFNATTGARKENGAQGEFYIKNGKRIKNAFGGKVIYGSNGKKVKNKLVDRKSVV